MKYQKYIVAILIVCIVGAISFGYYQYVYLPGLAPTELEPIKIGAVYGITGRTAIQGHDAKDALLLAAEIINGKYDFPLPLAKTEGLPNLGGRKIKVIVGDCESDPKLAGVEAERLITMENVVALTGSYWSSLAETASATAERYEIPFLASDVTAVKLTEREFEWFFRTTPNDGHVAIAVFDFLDWLRENGEEIKTVVCLAQSSTYGISSEQTLSEEAERGGYYEYESIMYSPSPPDFSSEAMKIRDMDPDALIKTTSPEEGVLLMQTFKELDYTPKLIYHHSALNPYYWTTLEGDSDYLYARGLYSSKLAEARPWVAEVEKMYRDITSVPFSDASARPFMGLIVLADAINRAGSTDPEAIRQALIETKMSSEEMILPWNGVEFDEKGQNQLGSVLVLQISPPDQELEIIYPEEFATSDYTYPMIPWGDR